MESCAAWSRVLDALAPSPGASVLDVADPEDDAFLRALADRDPDAAVVRLALCREVDPSATHREADLPRLSRLRRQLSPGAFDLIVLRHALDDIVEALVAHHEHIGAGGTGDEDRAAVVRALRAYWHSGDLDSIVVPPFIDLMKSCRTALRPNGSILCAHQVFDADLRLGHPLELYADYVPLARRWVTQAALPLRELPLEGLDPHWWLCLRAAEEAG